MLEDSNATIKNENFVFPTADGTAQLFGRDHGVRGPTLGLEQLVRSENLWKTSRKLGEVPNDRNK